MAKTVIVSLRNARKTQDKYFDTVSSFLNIKSTRISSSISRAVIIVLNREEKSTENLFSVKNITAVNTF